LPIAEDLTDDWAAAIPLENEIATAVDTTAIVQIFTIPPAVGQSSYMIGFFTLLQIESIL
jgi:hypothetical protein